ncbi:hypothetical protein [uncultured Gimesia sp.]|uniref:hypothetical protein n=1 Tax=uncultured Gimesia sp. TaxID=1678688 RepID=UPI00263207F3|nr:hypothetical protein [uncultured Gimesia sp.]
MSDRPNTKRLHPNLEDAGVFVCLDVPSSDTSSGGGIRTPDTRIMIPQYDDRKVIVDQWL